MSSTSELETSITENNADSGQQKLEKQKKQKQKEIQTMTTEKQTEGSPLETMELMNEMKLIKKHLEKLDNSMKSFDHKLGNVMMKDDTSRKSVMKNILNEMKDDLLRSVNKTLEVIEGKLFDKETEIDKLQKDSKSLQKCFENQTAKVEKLQHEARRLDTARKKYENEAEQYSRRSNIKISGIEDNSGETAKETAVKVIQLIKEKKIYELTMDQIDIAHRLPNKKNTNHDITVKFVSRNVKDCIMRNRKLLKGSGIFINDLTRTNFHVLMCVKRKMKDGVKEAWTTNGKILYRNCAGQVHVVEFEDYEHWMDLPWPE